MNRRVFLGLAGLFGGGILAHHKPGHAHHKPGHGTTTTSTTSTTLPATTTTVAPTTTTLAATTTTGDPGSGVYFDDYGTL